MCGIAGIIHENAKQYEPQLKNMVRAIKHRGPDGDGVYFFNNCALGHVRLSIVDLKSGDQPMLDHNQKNGIVFNGEIYGYRDIKKTLAGCDFRTSSDTEVILALYEKYGAKMMAYLPGMFSFALWNEKKQELFCARDRFGEKPFYYALGKNGEFIFASEIKAILATGLVEPVLDKISLVHYLQHLYVSPWRTIYKNIFTLPPAHSLFYRSGRISISKYWRIPETNITITMDEAIDKFRNLLSRAVEKQLVADVPVGVFLSGGLDSSTITAIAGQHRQNIQTFSFGFEKSRSELPFARAVADKYKTRHTELKDDNADIGKLLLRMREVYDEPFADSSNIPTYLLAELSRRYAKVILTGDGGDELLGGYRSWYKPLLYFDKKNQASFWRLFMLRTAAKACIKMNLGRGFNLTWKYQGLKYGRIFNSVLDAHRSQNNYFDSRELSLLGLDVATQDSPASDWPLSGTVNDAMRSDTEDYMPGDILVKIDRASMAHGLELRSPFLDVDLASFCLSLPARLKITETDDKIILRQAFSSDWPAEIRNRGKQGFGSPVKRWLKLDSVAALKDKYLNDNKQKVFNLVSFENSRGFAVKNNYQTWILLTLALWADKHSYKLD